MLLAYSNNFLADQTGVIKAHIKAYEPKYNYKQVVYYYYYFHNCSVFITKKGFKMILNHTNFIVSKGQT